MEFLLSLRRRGISDAAVLRAMDEVPREDFVLPSSSRAAYADQAMPIACGQTISQPYVVAYMTEQLAVTREHRVLEIGTGSGYQAAILSQLAGAGVHGGALPHAAEIARARRWPARLRQRHGDGRRRAATACPSTRPTTASSSRRRPRASRRRLVDQLAERRRDGAAAGAARRRRSASSG